MELPFFGTYYNFLKEYSDRRRSPRHTRDAQARRAATTKFQEKNTREIRRFPFARRDASFFNRPVRYGVFHPRGRYVVLRPRGEIRRPSTARWDTTFFSRAPRYDVLPLSRRYKECLRSHVCHPRLRLGGQFTCDLGHSLLLLPRCVIYYYRSYICIAYRSNIKYVYSFCMFFQ